jgi:hypothetical protein
MRCLTFAALLAFALPASAQTHLADSTGGYVALHGLSFGSVGQNTHLSGDGTVGWRHAGGLDYGLRVASERGGRGSASSSAFRAGPTVGYTRRIGWGVLGRVEGAALYQSATFRDYDFEDVTVGDDGRVVAAVARTAESRWLVGDVTASVARPVRLVGSVRLHPTLGGFVAASASLSYRDSAYPSLDPDARTAAGVHFGLPLSFRLFGQDIALASYAQIPLTDQVGLSNAHAGGGLRLNF